MTALLKNFEITHIGRRKILTVTLLLIPTLIIFILLLKLNNTYCCDASYYLKSIKGYQDQGIFYEPDYLGYRSYLFPYFYSMIPFELSKIINIGSITLPLYSIFSIGFFIIIEFII